MLKKLFCSVVAFAAVLPLLCHVVFGPVSESETDADAKKKVHHLINHGVRERRLGDDELVEYIPKFWKWKEERDLPDFFKRSLPPALSCWLRKEPPERVEEVLQDTLASLRAIQRGRRSGLWRACARAVCDTFLLDVLDITLEKGLLGGVEAYLYLPGFDTLKHHTYTRLERQRLDHYRSGWAAGGAGKRDGAYPVRPWFMIWHGEEALARLLEVTDSDLKASIAEAMNRALMDWDDYNHIVPWLPLAYLSALPGSASPEALEQYLSMAVSGEPCPYLPNAAALYLHTADWDRIFRFMDGLKAKGVRLGYPADTRNPPSGAAVLYWFFHGAAPFLCSRETASALQSLDATQSLEGDPSGVPHSLKSFQEMWSGVDSRSLQEQGAFFALMQKLSGEPLPIGPDHRFMEME